MPSRVRLVRAASALLAALAALAFVLPTRAAAPAAAPASANEGGLVDDAGACGPAKACPLDEIPPGTSAGDASVASAAALVFFWGVGCPHCEEAKPFVDQLERDEPSLRVDRVEVRQDPEGRRRFLDTMTRLGATAAGIPTFVVGSAYVVGYERRETDRRVRALVERAVRPGAVRSPPDLDPRSSDIHVPLLGAIDPASVSLPLLTVAIGLVDGVNPCAMWVLIVLLGILLHVKAKRRMVLYAATFIVMSGVVYFGFMTAWTTFFQLVGLSRAATRVLGGALLAMGLVNLKELVWFKKGPSLVIPSRAKPGLFRRMRAIAGAASLASALGGILVLAFVVNLIELGCTIGLPAVYTRILTTRALPAAARYGYLALYNVAYVVPLFAIALTFIVLQRRLTMTERAAKVLKAVSGVLLTAFGATFLLVPGWLVG